MTRIASFADGFTSSTAPTIEGATQDNYTILNNQIAPLELFAIDALEFKSVFISFELERLDISNEYRQTGSLILSYDGSNWVYNLGNYQGDDIITDTIVNTQDVKFEISTIAGVGSFKYSSGNMGASYTGSLKAITTRILA